MGISTKVAVWLVATSLVVLATVALIGLFESRSASTEEALLSDADLVWCDANRSVVALAAQSLGLLPEDLESRLIDVTADDPPEAEADLSEDTSLEILRNLREMAEGTPPQQFADLGYRTPDGFEKLYILGPRAMNAASNITSDWVDDLDSGWGHRDAVRVCKAAVLARS